MPPDSKYFFLIWIMTIFCVQADNFVYDYFVYKGVTRVTKFSCEEIEKDYHFVKKMNELKIYAAVHNPQSELYDASMSGIVKRDSRNFGLFFDSRCQTSETSDKIIAQTTHYRLYDGIHIWLILATSLEETVKLLNDLAYSLQTELTIAVETKMGYKLYDVYNPCKIRGGDLHIDTLGFWNSENGLNITLTESKIRRRSNLQGMKLKVVTVVKYQPPDQSLEEYLEDYATKSLDPISKYGWAIATQLAELWNYSMEVQQSSEWIITINDTEQGMMAMLDRGEVDIGLSPGSATMRYAAKPYGRMLMPGYPYRTFFIFRSTEVEKLKWMELLTPFAFDSWYAIFLTGMISIIIITAIQMSEYGEGWIAESGHAIFATIGALSQQGLTFVPNRISGRIAFLFLLILGVLLSNYYGASVVSARLNEPMDKMNDSLYSLAKSHMSLTSEPYRFVDDILAFQATYNWEVRYFNEKVWTKLGLSKYELPEQGLAKIGTGNHAYHTSPEVAYPYVDSHFDDEAICSMTEVHVINPRILVFYERVDSPFTELTKIGLIKTDNIGLRARTIKRWKPKTPYCSPDARSLERIGINDIAPSVIMIGIAIVISLILFYGEIFMFRLQRENRKGPMNKKKMRIVGKKKLQRIANNK